MTEKINDHERRKSSRVDFKTEINIKTPSRSYRLEGNSRDISQKGVYVFTDEDISLETLCEITLVLEGSVPTVKLEITGKVVRKTEDGVGIEFIEMDLDSYTHLKNIVKFNSKES